MRRAAPAGFLIGRSVHSAREAEAVASPGALDYIVLGTVFATASKPGRIQVTGTAELTRAVRAVTTPILAIGGVTLDRIPEIARSGAAGFAAIGLFAEPFESTDTADLESRLEMVRERFDTC